MWIVFLRSESGVENINVKLDDLKELIGEYRIRVKKEFFDRLLYLIKKKKHYTSHYAIEKVENNKGEDWSNNSWYLVVSVDSNNLIYWLLIKQEPDEKGIVVGVGPAGFTQIVKEKKETALEMLIYWILEDPKRWNKISVIVN